jgi:hypothetical protein
MPFLDGVPVAAALYHREIFPDRLGPH